MTDDIGRVGFRTGVVGSVLYSLVRFWLAVIATSHGDQAKLQDSVQAISFMRRFGAVTALNGHVHQSFTKVEGEHHLLLGQRHGPRLAQAR